MFGGVGRGGFEEVKMVFSWLMMMSSGNSMKTAWTSLLLN